MTAYYHRTFGAETILRDGFADSTGSYGFKTLTLSGVWISDEPLDVNEGADGDTLLRLDPLGEVDLDPFEVVEELTSFREWCVPAEMLNRAFRVTVVDEADV